MSEDVACVPVELGGRRYDVLVGPGALAAAQDRLGPCFPRGRAILVTDRNVAGLHLKTVCDWLEGAGLRPDPVILEPGETSKSWAGLQALVDALLDRNVERGEAVIALGGGVVGDLTGFAAAITKRGVDFVQIPTTLLAQVDSSVGGKTGINTAHGKNLVGAFHQPRLVIADMNLLKTLPLRERRAGYAEIVKAALIGDKPLFEKLERAGKAALEDGSHLSRAVTASVAFKATIVARDEHERDARALLNLGHTFAHAFEAEAPRDAIRHGEAVAAGLALAFAYSAQLEKCPKDHADRVAAHLRAVGLPDGPNSLTHKDWSAPGLIARMRDDKKNKNGRITLILATGIANAYIDRDIDEDHLTRFLESQLS